MGHQLGTRWVRTVVAPFLQKPLSWMRTGGRLRKLRKPAKQTCSGNPRVPRSRATLTCRMAGVTSPILLAE